MRTAPPAVLRALRAGVGARPRARVLAFLAIVAALLAVAPAVNLVANTAARMPQAHAWSTTVLFNLDFLLPLPNRVLWRAGISTDPGQVVVGRNGWLYLGDRHGSSLTAKRRGVTPQVEQQAADVVRAMQARQIELRRRGVPTFRILVAPDKDTVYPEHLPDWARAAPRTPLDALMARAPTDLFVDGRAALRQARARGLEPLYLRTDTHWNHLGAWQAFQALGEAVEGSDPGLRWPGPQRIALGAAQQRPGGDLARFLWIDPLMQDADFPLAYPGGTAVTIEAHDLASGARLPFEGNPDMDAPPQPMVVRARGAANAQRVLWVRDSFGTAMAPFMAAAFGEVVQTHYIGQDEAAFWALVDRVRPTAVLVTVVQRNAFHPWLQGR